MRMDGSLIAERHVARARERMASDDVAMELAETFGALADPTRIRIVSALADTELCVGDLAAALDMTISAVSHQLGLLRRLRLVRARREGKHMFYSLDDDHVTTLYRCGLDHLRHA